MDFLEPILSEAPNLCRVAVAAVLLLSGLVKLVDVSAFARVLSEFQLIPTRTVRPSAIAIPTLEVVLGGWLSYGGRGTPLMTAAASGLFLVFALGIARVLHQGRSPECGCFGRLVRSRATPWALARNVAFALAAAAGGLGDASGPLTAGWPSLLVATVAATGMLLAAEIRDLIRAGQLVQDRPAAAHGRDRGRSPNVGAVDP